MSPDPSPISRWACSLSLSSSLRGGDLTIAAVGEVDWTTADAFADRVIDHFDSELRTVVLDLSGLTFCNLRGLGALHEAVAVARRAGIDVTLRGMPRQLAWLHCSFPDRMSSGRTGQEIPWIGPRQGALAVEPLPADHPWESAVTG